jgi:hypothetical protein
LHKHIYLGEQKMGTRQKADDGSARHHLAQTAQDMLDAGEHEIQQQHWLGSILPILKQGGNPVAIILALGAAGIPLMVSGNGERRQYLGSADSCPRSFYCRDPFFSVSSTDNN